MPQTTSPAAPPAFLWKVDGVSVEVAISQAVLAKFHALAGDAASDTEWGGILLGSVISSGAGFQTRVDAFEAFPIEHRHGSSYALSARDERLLNRRLQRLRRMGLSPVGLCRGHQRRGLYLDRRDFDLFQADFRHPASVFLLVRRDDDGGVKGAVFVWEEDDIRRHTSYLEFPIETAGLPALQAAARPVPASVPWARVTPGAAAKVLVTVALPLFSFYAAREIAMHRALRPEETPARPAAPAPRRGSDSDVAPAVEQKPRPFSDPSSSVTPAGLREPAEPKSKPDQNSRDRFEGTRPPSEPPVSPVETSPARAIPTLPDPPPVQPGRPAAALPRIVASLPISIAPAPEKVVAFLKPVSPSSPIRSAFEKVLTGHGAGNGFVAANPVEHPLPASPSDAVLLDKGTSIEMLAKVDRYGNVVNVKITEGNRKLADASAEAVLRWRFDPARRNGTPVDSAMRIRFEFRNPYR